MITLNTQRHRLVIGYMASLGAALAYAVAALVARNILRDYAPALVGSAFSLMFGTVIVAALFHRDAVVDSARAPRRAWLMVALAGCASALGVSCWFLALSNAPIILVAPITGTSPLVSILLTHFFLQRLEKVTWRTVTGALLVVGGVVLIAVGSA
jgi:drug/metabolite transporter (DMT)-like permease